MAIIDMHLHLIRYSIHKRFLATVRSAEYMMFGRVSIEPPYFGLCPPDPETLV